MVTTERTKYVLVLRPEPGVNAIRSLRMALKALLRRYGLRVTDIAAIEDPSTPAPLSEGAKPDA